MSYSQYLQSFYAPILNDPFLGAIDPTVFKIVPHFYLALTQNSITTTNERSPETGHIWRSWGVVTIRGRNLQGNPSVLQIAENTKSAVKDERTSSWDNRSNIIGKAFSSDNTDGVEMLKHFHNVFGLIANLPEFLYYEHFMVDNSKAVIGSGVITPGKDIIYIRFPRPYSGPWNGESYEYAVTKDTTYMSSTNGDYSNVFDTDLFSDIKPREFQDPDFNPVGAGLTIVSSKSNMNMSPTVCRQVIEAWYDLGKEIQPLDFVNAYPALAAYLTDPYLAFNVALKMYRDE